MAGPLRWPPGAKRTVGRAARRTRVRGSWRRRSRTSAPASWVATCSDPWAVGIGGVGSGRAGGGTTGEAPESGGAGVVGGKMWGPGGGGVGGGGKGKGWWGDDPPYHNDVFI